MTLQDIMARLQADGYTTAYSDAKQIYLPGKGEIELAYGEAKIFDAKFSWPEFGNHPCHKDIDALFEDIHNTWPIEKTDDPKTDDQESLPIGDNAPAVRVGVDAE